LKIKKELKVGFAVLIFLAFALIGFYLIQNSSLFKKKSVVYAVFTKNEGLIEASPLLLNGYKIGEVDRLDLLRRDTAFQVLITFVLFEEVEIPKNSIARMISQDILGTKVVSVEPGNSSDLLKNGDTLATGFQVKFKDEVKGELQVIKNKIAGLAKGVDSIKANVNEVMNPNAGKTLSENFKTIKKSVSALKRGVKRIKPHIGKNQANVTEILNKINAISVNITNNTKLLSDIIGNFSNIQGTVAQSRIQDVMSNANTALQEANLAFTQFSKGNGSIGKINSDTSLYNKLNRAAQDLNLLMQDVRYNPERYPRFSIFGKRSSPP
jgi:phospholipid/cholesterol/gamma-HCH transport system substrate-binding protein